MTSSPFASRSSRHERFLLLAAQRHDRRATEQLLERYQPLLCAAARRYQLPRGLERDDLMQEARIGLLRAITNWRLERGPFAPFARRCVHNHLIHALDTAGARKHQILSRAVPLPELTGGGAPSRTTTTDEASARPGARRHVPALTGQPPPDVTVFARERIARLAAAMELLSEWERDALRASMNGIDRRRTARER